MRKFNNGFNPLYYKYCDRVDPDYAYYFYENKVPIRRNHEKIIITDNPSIKSYKPTSYYKPRRLPPIQYVYPESDTKGDLVYYVDSPVPFNTGLSVTKFAPKKKSKKKIRIAPETYATFGVFRV